MIKKIIPGLITFSIIAAANAERPTEPIPVKNKLDQTYFGISTSHAFKTTTQGADKKHGYKTTPPNFDVALGRYINDQYRLELALGYRQFKYSNTVTAGEVTTSNKHKVNFYRAMLNNYFELPFNNERFAPYAMVGVGIGHAHSSKYYNTIAGIGSATTNYKAKTNFNYQIGLGADIKFTDTTSLDLGVRHVDYGTIKASNASAKKKIRSNEIMLGLKFNI